MSMDNYKNPPSAAGAMEIGYAIAPGFRRQGLTVETAQAMVERAWGDERVRAVEAHTLAEENASTRLLLRLGFVRVAEVIDPDEGPLWRWRLVRDAALAAPLSR
jgi:ribosomal-protein-alanine N-acetyltransferase